MANYLIQKEESISRLLQGDESAGARTAVAVAGIPLCADHRSSNKHIFIPATRIM